MAVLPQAQADEGRASLQQELHAVQEQHATLQADLEATEVSRQCSGDFPPCVHILSMAACTLAAPLYTGKCVYEQ